LPFEYFIKEEENNLPTLEKSLIWKLKYSGQLFLSNKQIHLLLENREMKSLEFKKIIAFTPYPQGILLQLLRQKNIFLFCPAATEPFSLLLGRLFQKKN
jgi:hypothetical protein